MNTYTPQTKDSRVDELYAGATLPGADGQDHEVTTVRTFFHPLMGLVVEFYTEGVETGEILHLILRPHDTVKVTR